MPKQVIVAYVPVVHRGYLDMFAAYPEARSIYLIDRTTLHSETIDYLRKDLRQLNAVDIQQLMAGLGRFDFIQAFNDQARKYLDTQEYEIILPDEDISREVAAQFTHANITYHGIFLRWDRRALAAVNVASDAKTSIDTDDVNFMNQAVLHAQASTDIWRRVGAVIIDDNKTVIDYAANQGESTLYSPWIEGDPRNIFNRGVGIEMSVFSHAEAVLVARAAKNGTSLSGSRIYTTDFPCPACAKLIAHSGMSHVYYKDGYAVLDGQRVLDEYGVTVIRVDAPDDDSHTEVWVPYTKS